jgi:hypothetical protein
MASYFHPWMHEVALVAGNRARAALTHWPETLFHLIAWSALLGGLGYAFSFVDGDRIGLVLESGLRIPLAGIAIVAAASWYACDRTLTALRHELAFGWWAATPIPVRATRLTLISVGAALGLALGLCAALALAGLVSISDRPERWFDAARLALLAGVPLGSAIALIEAWRGAAHGAPKVRAGSRGVPLWPWPAIDHPGLPHLGYWQRTLALRTWRGASGVWPWLLLGLTVPAGFISWSMLGLLATGSVLIWFGQVMAAARRSIVDGSALLAALPLPSARFIAATLRYPLRATLIAGAWIALGVALQSAPWPFVLGGPLLLLAWATLDLANALHYRRQAARGVVVLGAEAALLVALAMSAAPLAPVAWLALVIHHLRATRREP